MSLPPIDESLHTDKVIASLQKPALELDESVDEKREQVAKQCEAVVHLAKALAEVTGHKAAMFRSGKLDELIEMVGNRTAYQMQLLGDILNGMDAVDDEEDGWLAPVFEAAQQMFPQPSEQ